MPIIAYLLIDFVSKFDKNPVYSRFSLTKSTSSSDTSTASSGTSGGRSGGSTIFCFFFPITNNLCKRYITNCELLKSTKHNLSFTKQKFQQKKSYLLKRTRILEHNHKIKVAQANNRYNMQRERWTYTLIWFFSLEREWL